MSKAVVSIALLVAALGSGCATIVKGGRNELKLSGAPADLRAFAGADELNLVKTGADKNGTNFKAQVSKDVQQVNLRVNGRDLPVNLTKRLGAGWLIADIALTFGVGCIVDAASGRWKDLREVEVNEVVARANDPQQPPVEEVAKAPEPERSKPKKGAPPVISERRDGDDRRGNQPREPSSLASSDRAAVTPTGQGSGRRDGPVIRSGKIAVLDFKSYAKDFKPEDVRYFTDLVRGATLRAAPGLEVMTRENLLVLLQATGKTLDQCEGECEVDTGRRIGADAVISGDVLKVGSRYKMSLRLHDTHAGRLLSTAIASGKTVDELDEALTKAAEDLMNPRR